MCDIAGNQLMVGDTVVATYNDRLYGGVITKEYIETGAVDVTLVDPSFVEPIVQHYLFPNTQLFYTESRALDRWMSKGPK